MKARRYAPLLLLIALPIHWVLNCSGPRPVAGQPQVQAPSTPGAPYQMTVVVKNDGPGHGQAQVTFDLQDTRTGKIYQQQETVTLESGQSAVVSANINAPLGSYQPSVQVSYPPG